MILWLERDPVHMNSWGGGSFPHQNLLEANVHCLVSHPALAANSARLAMGVVFGRLLCICIAP